MNAGTSLRAEGAITRLAASNISLQALDVTRKPRPAVASFLRTIWSQSPRNQTSSYRVDRLRAHH
jgi:hypothetical protein